MFCIREFNLIAVVVFMVLLCRVECGYVADNSGLTPAADGINTDSVYALEDHHREKRSDKNNIGYLDRVAKYLTENLNVEFDRLVNKTIGEYNGNDKFGESN